MNLEFGEWFRKNLYVWIKAGFMEICKFFKISINTDISFSWKFYVDEGAK
jgi:hypothetical protein